MPHCVLCKHNPNKRCTGNFAAKYWVGDRLLAKCEGEIQVELIDTSTGERVVDDLSGYRIEARACSLWWSPVSQLSASTNSCSHFMLAAGVYLRREQV